MKTFYHMGFVVADLKAATAELSSAMGVEWNEPLERELGPWKYRITFSKAGQPFLELIEAPPGGPWEAGTGPDHLGYWTDDLEQDKARLDESGLLPDFDDREYGRPFTYHRSARFGTRIGGAAPATGLRAGSTSGSAA